MENVFHQNRVLNVFAKKERRGFFVNEVSEFNLKLMTELKYFLFFVISIYQVLKTDDSKYCPLDCQAGGTCVYVQSQAQCRCPPNRSGRLCERSKLDRNSNFEIVSHH